MLYNDLNTIRKKARKRVGRGNGSGHGTYSCRGMNGQSARSGGKRKAGFEGGQTSLLRRMPKLGGFTNINQINYLGINLSVLDRHFKDGETVNNKSLLEKKLIHKNDNVKILGNGEITKSLNIEISKITKSATEKLNKAKCTIKA